MAFVTGQDLFCIQLFQSLYLYQILAIWDLYSYLCGFDSLYLLPMNCSSLTSPDLYLYHQTSDSSFISQNHFSDHSPYLQTKTCY